jgi:hypothetical protein
VRKLKRIRNKKNWRGKTREQKWKMKKTASKQAGMDY